MTATQGLTAARAVVVALAIIGACAIATGSPAGAEDITPERIERALRAIRAETIQQRTTLESVDYQLNRPRFQGRRTELLRQQREAEARIAYLEQSASVLRHAMQRLRALRGDLP